MGVSEERLVFHDTFVGLWVRGLSGKVTPALRDALRAEGFDIEKVLPAYPLSVWKSCLRRTAELLYPGLPADKAYYELGARFIAGFFETLLGRALMPVFKLLSPRRTLEKLQGSFRKGNNFSETRIEWLDERHGRLWVNETFGHPAFCAGFLEYTSHHVTMNLAFKAAVIRVEGDGAVFDLTW